MPVVYDEWEMLFFFITLFVLDGVCSVYMQQILPKSCHKAIKMMIFYEPKKHS